MQTLFSGLLIVIYIFNPFPVLPLLPFVLFLSLDSRQLIWGCIFLRAYKTNFAMWLSWQKERSCKARWMRVSLFPIMGSPFSDLDENEENSLQKARRRGPADIWKRGSKSPRVLKSLLGGKNHLNRLVSAEFITVKDDGILSGHQWAHSWQTSTLSTCWGGNQTLQQTTDYASAIFSGSFAIFILTLYGQRLVGSPPPFFVLFFFLPPLLNSEVCLWSWLKATRETWGEVLNLARQNWNTLGERQAFNHLLCGCHTWNFLTSLEFPFTQRPESIKVFMTGGMAPL